MNRVTRRARLLLIFILGILLGLFVFVIRYMQKGEEWVTFPGSPHIYSSGNLSLGVVTDRSGTLLLDAEGGRTFSPDYSLRKSVIHVLGDRDGYISAPLLSHYAGLLLDYDSVDGISRSLDKERVSALTLSAKAQKTAQQLMEGKRGVVAVYNYRTGETLCLLSAPNYDPDNVPDIEGDESGVYEGAYVNRYFKSSYTPGSIFKIITLSAALENLEHPEELTFHCEGSCIIGGEEIICSGIHGDETLMEAFSNSCNCAFAELTAMIGPEVLTRYVEMSGLTESYDLEGITVKAGNFDLQNASKGSVSWAGVGQYTDLVNPCSYLTYMGMIAGNGTAARPYLMKEITLDGESSYSAEGEFLSCPLKASTMSQITEGMRNNVLYKYGPEYFPDLKVCAKSGTAETAEDKEPNAMFAGFIDDEEYPLAFFVAVEEGGYGSSTAAPIAGRVLQVCVDVMQEERG